MGVGLFAMFEAGYGLVVLDAGDAKARDTVGSKGISPP